MMKTKEKVLNILCQAIIQRKLKTSPMTIVNFLILCIMYMCRRQFNSQSFSNITFVLLHFSIHLPFHTLSVQFFFLFTCTYKATMVSFICLFLKVTKQRENAHYPHRFLSHIPTTFSLFSYFPLSTFSLFILNFLFQIKRERKCHKV